MKKVIFLLFFLLSSLYSFANYTLSYNGEKVVYDIYGEGFGHIIERQKKSECPWGLFVHRYDNLLKNRNVKILIYNANKPKKEAKKIEIEVEFFGDAKNGRLINSSKTLHFVEDSVDVVKYDFTVPDNCTSGGIHIYYHILNERDKNSAEYIYIHEEFTVSEPKKKPSGHADKSLEKNSTTCPVCDEEDTGLAFKSIKRDVKKRCANDDDHWSKRFMNVNLKDMIYYDDWIKTGAKSQAVLIDLQKTNTFTIKENSSVLMSTQSVTLKAGKFIANVKRKIEGKPWYKIETPTLFFGIKGTIVACETSEKKSKVWLFAGEVSVDNKKTGKTTVLKPGQNITCEGSTSQVKKFDLEAGAKKFGISMDEIKEHNRNNNGGATDDTNNPKKNTDRIIKKCKIKGVDFSMIKVEGGTFTMGATKEQGSNHSNQRPTHKVTLSTYYIGETEVTQELWEAVMGNNPSKFKGAKLPVENVSWNECQQFISKINQLTGRKFRLPTEAEWEFAARGGKASKGYKFAGSNNADAVAWHSGNSNNTTHKVGTKTANELGIYDMCGNVWEWCQDWFGDYSSSAQTNPKGASSGTDHLNRGGAWCHEPKFATVFYRGTSGKPDRKVDNLGFRLVLEP